MLPHTQAPLSSSSAGRREAILIRHEPSAIHQPDLERLKLQAWGELRGGGWRADRVYARKPSGGPRSCPAEGCRGPTATVTCAGTSGALPDPSKRHCLFAPRTAVNCPPTHQPPADARAAPPARTRRIPPGQRALNGIRLRPLGWRPTPDAGKGLIPRSHSSPPLWLRRARANGTPCGASRSSAPTEQPSPAPFQGSGVGTERGKGRPGRAAHER